MKEIHKSCEEEQMNYLMILIAVAAAFSLIKWIEKIEECKHKRIINGIAGYDKKGIHN